MNSLLVISENLSWLIELISTAKWSQTTKRYLGYPELQALGLQLWKLKLVMLWIARSKTVNVITTNCLFDATNDHNGLPWISVDCYSPSSLISDGFFNLHLIYEGATELFVVMNPSRGHFKVSITALKRWSKCERSLSVAFQWYRIHSWWSMHEYFWAAVKFKKRAHQFRSAYVWSYHFIWDNVGIYTAP